MSYTTIEWADLTINPVVGCSKCSPGCDNCYAEHVAARLAKNPATAAKYAGVVGENGKWTGKISPMHDLSMFNGLPRKPQRIFVGSMTDMFHPSLDDKGGEVWRALIDVIGMNPRHTFMFLTKRPERMRSDIEWLIVQDGDLPDNIWLGVTVCGPDELWKIAVLLQTPAAKRFVSFEPLLGPVYPTDLDWSAVLGSTAVKNALSGEVYIPGNCGESSRTLQGKAIDWVICGGETGPGARPMHPGWVRSLRDDCQKAGVPFFFKGWGEWREATKDERQTFANLHPNPTSHFGFIKQFSQVALADGSPAARLMRRVGKKRAGRLLDGREWNEFPDGGSHGHI